MKKLIFGGIAIVVLVGAFVISSLYIGALNKKAYEEISTNFDAYISTFSKFLIKALSAGGSNPLSIIDLHLEHDEELARVFEEHIKEDISLSFSPYKSGFLSSSARATLYLKDLDIRLYGDVKFHNVPFGKRAEITLISPDLKSLEAKVFKDGIFAKVGVSKGFGDAKLEITPIDIDFEQDDENMLKLQGAKINFAINDEFKISEEKLNLDLFEFKQTYSGFVEERHLILVKDMKSYQKYKEPVGLEDIFDLSKEIASNFKGSIKHIEVDSGYAGVKAENWDFKGDVALAFGKGVVSGNVTSGLKKFTITDNLRYRKKQTDNILNLADVNLELDFIKNLDTGKKHDEMPRAEFVLKNAQMLFDGKKIELTSDLSFAEIPMNLGPPYWLTDEDIKFNLHVSSKYGVRELFERYVKDGLMTEDHEALAIGDEIFKKDEKGNKYTLDVALKAKSLETNPHILINGKDICKTSFGAELGICFGSIDDDSKDAWGYEEDD